MKRIGLAQMNIVYGNMDLNFAKMNELLKTAINERCDLLLLPELWSSGFDLHHMDEVSKFNFSLREELQEVSNDQNLSIGGTFIEYEENVFFNTLFLLIPHQHYIKYQKQHLFAPMNEDKYFTPGKRSIPQESLLGITGMAVCFDLRFPEHFLELSRRGVEFFLISAHWPKARIHHWDILLQARAIENQAYVIAVNSVGISGKDNYGGTSMVVAPDGEIILRAPENEEGLFIADIETDLVQKIRKTFVMKR